MRRTTAPAKPIPESIETERDAIRAVLVQLRALPHTAVSPACLLLMEEASIALWRALALATAEATMRAAVGSTP